MGKAMRRGICGSYSNDLGLLSNFKSVRIVVCLTLYHFVHFGVHCVKAPTSIKDS